MGALFLLVLMTQRFFCRRREDKKEVMTKMMLTMVMKMMTMSVMIMLVVLMLVIVSFQGW